MVGVRLRAGALALVATVWADAALAQQPISGRSETLGITFAGRGEAEWCGPTVSIDLAADTAAAYDDMQAVQQMVGRIRAAVGHPRECPKAELVYFHAFAGGEPYFSMLATRLGRWRVFDVDPATLMPRCLDADADDARCADRVAAFSLMHQLFAEEAFSDLQLTEMLSVATASPLAWRGRASEGRLDIFDAEPGTSTATLADGAAEKERSGCEAKGGRFEVSTNGRSERVTSARTRCRKGGRTTTIEYVAWLRGSALYLFRIAATGSDVEAARTSERLVEMLPQIE